MGTFAASLILASRFLLSTATTLPSLESNGPEMFQAVEAVLSSQPQHDCPVFLLVNNALQITLSFLKEAQRSEVPQGVALFQVAADTFNETYAHLRDPIDQIRYMGEVWRCLALVVVSDDPTFLATFAHLSLRRHALKWSTRILVLTRLPLTHLGGLHRLLSSRNAMLLLPHRDKPTFSGFGIYVAWPYSAPTTQPRKVGAWTPTKTWTSQIEFFPEKFSVFASAPTLTLAIEVMPYHTLIKVDDPEAPQGYRFLYTGHVAETIRYIASGMNFTYRYVVSPERSFGTKLSDGSWTGMMGMVVREEVDFSAGPFMLSPARAEAGDHTMAIWTGNVRMVSGLGGLKIDPWGFLQPLTPLVWEATLMALLGLLAVLYLFPFYLPGRTLSIGNRPPNIFNSVRIILQQDIVLLAEWWWWWERLVLGVWMLTTLTLTKSYAGNLMSLLAVRYIPQPFQTPRDVLNDPHVSMIWQKYSKNEEFLREVQSGVFREVAEMEKKGRLLFHTQAQLPNSLDTLVRAGDHVLVDIDITITNLLALDVSQKGRCDFYLSREGFLPFSSAMMSQKTNPIIHGINPRLMALSESGLFNFWAEVPNFTRCSSVPKRLLINTSLSTTNLWGVFVVLVVGVTTGLLVWCAELLVSTTHSLPGASFFLRVKQLSWVVY